MNAKQTLIALVIAAVAPLAAQAESRFGEGYPIAMDDAAGTATRDQVRSEFLASAHGAQRFGEAYPVAIDDAASKLTRAEVRADFLAMTRGGQRFGEAYPTYGATKFSVAGMHADVR
ncbi:MAG TPA: hypothetical protein VMG60_19715 [Burkholderiaceae bacterium]|nr:hypothetical protein [Burkholderiaceae bacterium]